MGKKEKTKLKSKSAGGTEGNTRSSERDDFDEDADPATIAGWGPQSNAGDKIDGFGPDGWGEGHVEEQQPLAWQDEPGGGGTWDSPAPDLGTVRRRCSHPNLFIGIAILRSMDGRQGGRNPGFVWVRTQETPQRCRKNVHGESGSSP